LLLPWVLAKYSYVANVAQTAASILGITLTFSLFPAGFAILKAVSLWIYPLTQSKVNTIESELAARRAITTPQIKPA
jgi:GPH family glycoside/pentoside/hexuronide:cation symporter